MKKMEYGDFLDENYTFILKFPGIKLSNQETLTVYLLKSN
jgi:hypothetical protein